MPSLSIPGRVTVTLRAKRMGDQSPGNSCWAAGLCGDLPKILRQKSTLNLLLQLYKLILLHQSQWSCANMEQLLRETVCSIPGISQCSQMFWWFNFQRQPKRGGFISLNWPWQPRYQLFRNPWLLLGTKSQADIYWAAQDFCYLNLEDSKIRELLWGRFWLILHQLRDESVLSAGWPTIQYPLTWKTEFRNLCGFSGSWSWQRTSLICYLQVNVQSNLLRKWVIIKQPRQWMTKPDFHIQKPAELSFPSYFRSRNPAGWD